MAQITVTPMAARRCRLSREVMSLLNWALEVENATHWLCLTGRRGLVTVASNLQARYTNLCYNRLSTVMIMPGVSTSRFSNFPLGLPHVYVTCRAIIPSGTRRSSTTSSTRHGGRLTTVPVSVSRTRTVSQLLSSGSAISSLEREVVARGVPVRWLPI